MPYFLNQQFCCLYELLEIVGLDIYPLDFVTEYFPLGKVQQKWETFLNLMLDENRIKRGIKLDPAQLFCYK